MPVASVIITDALQVWSVVGGDRVGVKGQIDVSTVSYSVDGTSKSVQNQMGTVDIAGVSDKTALIRNYSHHQGLAFHQDLRIESKE